MTQIPDAAAVQEAEAVIKKHGEEIVAATLIGLIAKYLRENGKAIITTSDDSIGRRILEFKLASDNLRALSAEPEQGGQWSTDMDLAPSDTIVLMAWWSELFAKWEYEAGLYHCTKGGWRHGSATHWMPLPTAPTPEAVK